jgi:hypothetical protein
MSDRDMVKFTADDYEIVDDLIDEALNNMDRIQMNRLTILKRKIYSVLVADGLEDEVIKVIKKKWDIIEIVTEDGDKRFHYRRKGK